MLGYRLNSKDGALTAETPALAQFLAGLERFLSGAGNLGLSGPFAVSITAHLALIFLTAGGLWKASQQPYGILVERVGVPGGGAPVAPLTEFDVDYSAPSDVALAKPKKKRAKAETAPQTETPKAGEGGGKLGNAAHGAAEGVMGDPNGFVATTRQRYLYELKTFFDQRKTYPTAARTLGQTGQVEVAFQIKKDGTISEVTIVTPSGFERLNQAALLLVQNAKSFKPLPSELGMDTWKLSVPIRYELN